MLNKPLPCGKQVNCITLCCKMCLFSQYFQIDRLRKEGSKILEETQEKLRRDLEEQVINQQKEEPVVEEAVTAKIKVRKQFLQDLNFYKCQVKNTLSSCYYRANNYVWGFSRVIYCLILSVIPICLCITFLTIICKQSLSVQNRHSEQILAN